MNFNMSGKTVNLSGEHLKYTTIDSSSFVNAALIAAKLKLVSVAAKLVDQSSRYHGALTPLIYADSLNDLDGDSIVALDVKRFLTLNEGLSHNAQMTTEEGFDYLFNYGYRDGDENVKSGVTVPELVSQAIGGSDRLLYEGQMVMSNKQYTRNPKPKITISGGMVEIETPAGMKACIAAAQLTHYPEIGEEVVSCVQEVLNGRFVTPKGISDAYSLVRKALDAYIETGELGVLGDTERFRLSQEGTTYVLTTVRKNDVSFKFILYTDSGEFVLMVSSHPRRVFNEVTAHTELHIDHQLELIDLANYLS